MGYRAEVEKKSKFDGIKNDISWWEQKNRWVKWNKDQTGFAWQGRRRKKKIRKKKDRLRTEGIWWEKILLLVSSAFSSCLVCGFTFNESSQDPGLVSWAFHLDFGTRMSAWMFGQAEPGQQCSWSIRFGSFWTLGLDNYSDLGLELFRNCIGRFRNYNTHYVKI